MYKRQVYLGDKVNADLTLIPEIKAESLHSEYEYSETSHLEHSGYDNPHFAQGLRSIESAETETQNLPTTSGVENPVFVEDEVMRTV